MKNPETISETVFNIDSGIPNDSFLFHDHAEVLQQIDSTLQLIESLNIFLCLKENSDTGCDPFRLGIYKLDTELLISSFLMAEGHISELEFCFYFSDLDHIGLKELIKALNKKLPKFSYDLNSILEQIENRQSGSSWVTEYKKIMVNLYKQAKICNKNLTPELVKIAKIRAERFRTNNLTHSKLYSLAKQLSK
jgi:hypothetical protein